VAKGQGKARESRAKAKATLASGLGLAGAAVGAPLGPVGAVVGGAIGGVTGLIVGDEQVTFRVDYVAVPAHEYSLLFMGHTPTHTVFIKAGETLLPTGGNVDDVELGIQESVAIEPESKPARKKKPKLTAYNRFIKSFQYRKRFKTESGKDYATKRMKAAAKAWAKHKRAKGMK